MARGDTVTGWNLLSRNTLSLVPAPKSIHCRPSALQLAKLLRQGSRHTCQGTGRVALLRTGDLNKPKAARKTCPYLWIIAYQGS